jgi:hypothetical protein
MRKPQRSVQPVAFVLLGLAAIAAPEQVRADCAPVIVIPSRPDIPTVVNYFDARWAVVEGECGLNRPGHMAPVVIGGRFVGPVRGTIRRTRYFPATGQKPAQGRVETDMPPASPTAEDFSRSWSVGPARVPPADLPSPSAAPSGEGAVVNPPIVVVPQFGPKQKP